MGKKKLENEKKEEIEISYQEAMSEIEKLMEQMEADSIGIDELSSKLNRTMQLIRICKNRLYKTEGDIQKIMDEI